MGITNIVANKYMRPTPEPRPHVPQPTDGDTVVFQLCFLFVIIQEILLPYQFL